MRLRSWPVWKLVVALLVMGAIVHALQTSTNGRLENVISLAGSLLITILGVTLAGRLMGLDRPTKE